MRPRTKGKRAHTRSAKRENPGKLFLSGMIAGALLAWWTRHLKRGRREHGAVVTEPVPVSSNGKEAAPTATTGQYGPPWFADLSIQFLASPFGADGQGRHEALGILGRWLTAGNVQDEDDFSEDGGKVWESRLERARGRMKERRWKNVSRTALAFVAWWNAQGESESGEAVAPSPTPHPAPMTLKRPQDFFQVASRAFLDTVPESKQPARRAALELLGRRLAAVDIKDEESFLEMGPAAWEGLMKTYRGNDPTINELQKVAEDFIVWYNALPELDDQESRQGAPVPPPNRRTASTSSKQRGRPRMTLP